MIILEKMKTEKELLFHPENSVYDYMDSYEFVVMDPENRISISEVMETFLKPGPKWFEGLFSLRNKIASFFKLKTPATIKNEDNDPGNKWEVGTRAGVFKIFGKTTNEIIIGEDDKHLDVRVVLLLEQNELHKAGKKITVKTIVKLHNRLGRCYFFVVKPFHRTIIPFLLKRNFKQLESSSND